MVRQGNAWVLDVRLPADLAPLTLAYQVQLRGRDGGRNGGPAAAAATLSPRQGGNFCVPVGMLAGVPAPLGAAYVPVLALQLCSQWQSICC